MIAHSGLRIRQASLCQACMVTFLLMVVAYFLPAYGVSGTLADIFFKRSANQFGSNSMFSLFDIYGDNMRFTSFYFFVTALQLVLFIISINQDKIPVFVRFVVSVASFYVISFLFLVIFAAVDVEKSEILMSEWINLRTSIGIWILYLTFGIFVIYSYVEIWLYYKWYPAQTLLWGLLPIIFTIVSASLLSLLGWLFDYSIKVVYISFLLSSGIIVFVFLWKVKTWNLSLRRGVARRKDDPIYLAGEESEAESLAVGVDEGSRRNMKPWFVAGGIAMMCIILILVLRAGKTDGIQTEEEDVVSISDVISDMEDDVVMDESEELEFTPKAYDDEYDGSESESESSESVEVINPIPGATVFTGKLDGRYEIVMQFAGNGSDGELQGTYYYTKYKSPIALRGERDGSNVTLEEYTDGNLTGRFLGRVSESGFDGVWESADGSKTMDCTLSVVR